ncbi:MAG: FliH/SctL family protein [Jatrophihabitantaceae bacterium]
MSPSAGVPAELLAPARAAAQAAGYAAGWASGIRAARLVADAESHVASAHSARVATERNEQVRQALTAMQQAADVLESRAVPAAEQIEELIVSSALAIAEALVGRVQRDDAERGHAALTRALALAPANEAVVVALSPADYAALDAQSVVPQGISRSVSLVEDASLAPGDAVATSGTTSIDARLSTGLARVREVLAR